MLVDLIWFTKHSWRYMRGDRVRFYLHFIPSFIRFRKLGGTKHD